MASEVDNPGPPESGEKNPETPAPPNPPPGESVAPAGEPSLEQTTDASFQYSYYDDAYGAESQVAAPPPEATPPTPAPAPAAPASAGSPPPPPPPAEQPPEDADDDGMLRMSFMEHLDELRLRIIRSLLGIGVAFAVSLTFTDRLWDIVSDPAIDALKRIGARPNLAFMTPTEAFSIIWVKLPILTAIFIASPWVLYQVWCFIAPGLYKKERRWAAPFVLCTAGLFIAGGLFSYFVLFRFALEFLLGIGVARNVEPVVSITEYFNLFVNVTLGLGIVFELPILIFFLTLLHIVSPRFLMRNTRYAVLIIVILAAIITPTPDVVNLITFSVPMILLYFVGVFASYILVLHREQRRFPWLVVMLILVVLLGLVGGGVYLAVTRYGFHLVRHWPFLVR